MKDLDHYLGEAIKNIRDDREVTKELLDDVIRYLGKNEENHKFVGQTAAKYCRLDYQKTIRLIFLICYKRTEKGHSDFSIKLLGKIRS